MSVESHSAALEPIVKPLLEASYTDHWKDALNVLYFNGNVATFSEEYQQPCLISASGPIHEVEAAVDLLEGKTKVTGTVLAKKFLHSLMPIFLGFSRNEKVSKAIAEKNEGALALLFAKEYQSALPNIQKEMAPNLIQVATTISDLITMGMFDSLLELREKNIRSTFFDGDDYEEMINSLIGLNIIEQRIQISICPSCTNYQMIFTRHPSLTENCPRCGVEWASVTLMVFNPPYDNIKKNNSDLPLFISSYLRHKIFSLAPNHEVEIYPLAEIKRDGQKELEIDVYIPEYNLGIEVKVYEDAYARMTVSRLNSIVGRLVVQIEKYFKFGIEDVMIVTNIVESSTEKIEKSLKEKLPNERREKVWILPQNMDNLLDKLNGVAQVITNDLSEKFSKAFEQQDEQESIEHIEDDTPQKED